MSDDLVKKLRSQIGDDIQEFYSHEALFRLAADRIEELEAKLEKVVKVLETVVDQNGYDDDPWGIVRNALEELKGGKDAVLHRS